VLRTDIKLFCLQQHEIILFVSQFWVSKLYKAVCIREWGEADIFMPHFYKYYIVRWRCVLNLMELCQQSLKLQW